MAPATTPRSTSSLTALTDKPCPEKAGLPATASAALRFRAGAALSAALVLMLAAAVLTAPAAQAQSFAVAETNPFEDISVDNASTPTLADLDGDGDLDALVGELDGDLNYFENTGADEALTFTARTGTDNPFDDFNVDGESAPALGDLDGDGDLDALSGSYSGAITTFQNGSSTVLPVELAAFSAAADGQAALLSWQTASETHNQGFEVHRLLGSGAFALEGFVEGEGTTEAAQSYAFRTEALPVGTHRFRLKQLDLGGSGSYSAAVEVEIGVGGAYRLRAPAPNPVASGQPARLRLAVPEAQPVSARLYNMLGQQVATVYEGMLRPGASQALEVPTGRLAPGLYVVQVQGQGWTATRKVMVVR